MMYTVSKLSRTDIYVILVILLFSIKKYIADNGWVSMSLCHPSMDLIEFRFESSNTNNGNKSLSTYIKELK